MLENSRVRRPTTCGQCRLDDEGSSDAGEEPGTARNEFGVFRPRVLLEGACFIVNGKSIGNSCVRRRTLRGFDHEGSIEASEDPGPV